MCIPNDLTLNKLTFGPQSLLPFCMIPGIKRDCPSKQHLAVGLRNGKQHFLCGVGTLFCILLM
jgi:hypothetical protein